MLSDLHRAQAQIYRMWQRALIKRIREAERVAPVGGWELSKSERAELAEINAFLAAVPRNALALNDANQRELGGLTTQQLEHQLKAEFLRAAKTFTRREWAWLDSCRAKQTDDSAREFVPPRGMDEDRGEVPTVDEADPDDEEMT